MNVAIQDELLASLDLQKKAYQASLMTTCDQRVQLLMALKQALLLNQSELVSALSLDYGHRAEGDSIIADILPSIAHINYTIKHLKKWMKPQRRHAGLMISPASVTVHYQPLGVIGIIAPWNFPVILSINPLTTAIAAGCRAMIKLSEFTPNTNKVLKTILASVFEIDTVLVVEGAADVAVAFSALPFDHLLFTGSTAVGKQVMRAAAENLTPVTLELGGKSPVIIDKNMPMKTAVERLIFGKCLNAGQICVAPDYIFCPKGKESEFIAEYQTQFMKMYGSEELSEDYSNVVNKAQHARLIAWLEDAKSLGAKVISANRQAIDLSSRKIATQLITATTDEMQIMQNEIFGPLLPILSYEKIEDVITYITDRPRPLALYIMSFDTDFQDQLITQTHSGGVAINDVVMQVVADDAPFGGVGHSGMGHYHGHEGFLTFSKAKTVLKSGKLNFGKMVHPPYSGKLQTYFMRFFLR